MTPTTDGLQFDLASPAFHADPHPVFHRMRERAPAYRRVGRASGRAFWLVTRYQDVQQALADRRLARQLSRLPADIAAIHQRWEQDELSMLREHIFNLDPPDHTRIRRLLTPAFSARNVASLARRVRHIVADLMVDMEASASNEGTSDVIATVARPLSLMVMTELLGFPVDDYSRLRGWMSGLLHSRNLEHMRRCRTEFVTYINEQAAARRHRSGEDVLSYLVKAQQAGDQLSNAELVSTMFQLLFAGDETTVNMIGNGVLDLLRHPDQLLRLRAQPDLLHSAIEELARFNGPAVHARPLFAVSDLELAGVTVHRGEVVVPVLLAANRDPAVFADPHKLDISRHPNRHLAFGHGIHFCIGAALARIQVRTTVAALAGRFPDLHLACDVEDLAWTPDMMLHGVRDLPVGLGDARGEILS